MQLVSRDVLFRILLKTHFIPQENVNSTSKFAIRLVFSKHFPSNLLSRASVFGKHRVKSRTLWI